MLDDIERRRFLVDPARKNPLPALVGKADVDLDESAGQFLLLPRSRRLAGAKPDHDVLAARVLTRMQRNIANDAVALVEQAQHRHPLVHRC